MRRRDLQPERMDDPNLPADEHRAALVGLARLNRVSGVAGSMYNQVRRIARSHDRGFGGGRRPLTILDVASGAGDLPIDWLRRADRDGLSLEVTTTDVSPVAVEEQIRRAAKAGVALEACQHDVLAEPLPTGFDIVTCSLFFHHLTEHQAFCLLQSMQAASIGQMVICDLERSRINFGLVMLGARTLTRSSIVHQDAAMSVRAAFTIEEFRRLAATALPRPMRIRRAIPARFIATFEEPMVAEPVVAMAASG